jgi:hypothetical protein
MSAARVGYPHVAAAVGEGLARKREDCAIEARRIVEELSHIAFLDPLRLIDPGTGDLIDLRELPEDVRRAVKAVVVHVVRDAGGRAAGQRAVPGAMYDKLAALRQLAQLLGHLRDGPPAPPVIAPGDAPVMTDAELSEALMKLFRTCRHAERPDAPPAGGDGPAHDGELDATAQADGGLGMAGDGLPCGLRERGEDGGTGAPPGGHQQKDGKSEVSVFH